MTSTCNAWSNTQITFTSSFLSIFIAWFRISLAVDRSVAGALIVGRKPVYLVLFQLYFCLIRNILVLNISLSQKRPHMIFVGLFLPGHCCWPVLSMLPSFSIAESSGFWLFSVAEQTCLCLTSSKIMSDTETSHKNMCVRPCSFPVEIQFKSY